MHRPPFKQSLYHKTNHLTQFKITKYEPPGKNQIHQSVKFESDFEDLGDWAENIGFEFTRPLAPVCYKGSFATTVGNILDRGELAL
jgi:hypothetical protein